MTTHDSPTAAQAAWRLHVRRLGFPHRPGTDLAGCSVWLRYTWEGRRPSPLVEVTDAVRPPSGERLAALGGFLLELERQLAGPAAARATGLSVLRTRPGGGGPGADDRAWLSALATAAEEVGLSCVAACFASRDEFSVLGPADPLVVPAQRGSGTSTVVTRLVSTGRRGAELNPNRHGGSSGAREPSRSPSNRPAAESMPRTSVAP